MPPGYPGYSGQPTQAHQEAAGLVAALRQEATRLGFSRLGVTSASAPARQEQFASWLDRGFAGVMEGWLRRHLPLRGQPTSLLGGARSVVMLATDYVADQPTLSAADRGRVARYAWGDDYHHLLRNRLNQLGSWLEAQVPGCRTRGVVDSAPLSERELAARAGLGWFGKNTMLIDPRAGSYFFLSGLLTTVDLPIDQPLEVDHCGTCTACLDACPTDAFPEPRVLDASRCLSSLTIEDHGPIDATLRSGFGNWVFGCDICQEVCPWNRHAPGTAEPALRSRFEAGTLSLAEILRLDEATFRSLFRDSPLVRAKRRGLLRSAAIALGNHPAPETAHPDNLAALTHALADHEPVVRGAAAWALGQWRQRSEQLAEAIVRTLKTQLVSEEDPAVQAEITAALD
jgi:epoxyqueuosine reductase